jgi:hypothetical protein
MGAQFQLSTKENAEPAVWIGEEGVCLDGLALLKLDERLACGEAERAGWRTGGGSRVSAWASGVAKERRAGVWWSDNSEGRERASDGSGEGCKKKTGDEGRPADAEDAAALVPGLGGAGAPGAGPEGWSSWNRFTEHANTLQRDRRREMHANGHVPARQGGAESSCVSGTVRKSKYSLPE